MEPFDLEKEMKEAMLQLQARHPAKPPQMAGAAPDSPKPAVKVAKRAVATPVQAVVSPPIVQETKKIRVEPEQEPNQADQVDTAIDGESMDEQDYIPTPVKSLAHSLDAVATPTPQKKMSSRDPEEVPNKDAEVPQRTPSSGKDEKHPQCWLWGNDRGLHPDAASTEGLDRSKSIEDLVTSPQYQPLEIGNISLKVVLQPLFEQGWSPLKYGMHTLFEKATLWLKGLAGLSGEEIAGLPPVVVECLKDFRKLQASTVNLAEFQQEAQTKLSAVSKSAEVKFQLLAREVQGQPLDEAELYLKQRKHIIEEWVGKHQTMLEEEIEKTQDRHNHIRDSFEEKVTELVNIAHQEYCDTKVVCTRCIPEDTQGALLQDLEAELAQTLLDKATEDSKDTKVPIAPEGTCTEAFLKIQAAITNAFAGSAVPTATQQAASLAMVESLKSALSLEKKHDEEPPKPEIVVEDPAPATVQTLHAELQRSDTSRLNRGSTSDLENAELEKAKVVMPDGSIMYRAPKGKLETYEERQKRLGHNMYMKFSRTFESASIPKCVLEKAKNRKHNRALLQNLFEDWLSAGQDWNQSSVYLNAMETASWKKRGKHVYRTLKELKEKYGTAVALEIKTRKLEQERTRKPGEQPFFAKHPEVQNDEEWDLFRVWDSCEIEDEEGRVREWGVRNEGSLDNSEDAKGLLQRILANPAERESAFLPLEPQQGLPENPDQGLGGDAKGRGKSKKNGKGRGKGKVEGDDEPQPPPLPKYNKKVANKITSLTSKSTDVRCLETSIATTTLLSDGLKAGYQAELEMLSKKLEGPKSALEAFYAKRLEDKDIHDSTDHQSQLNGLIDSADLALNEFVTAIKPIRNAVAPPKPKAKAKAKQSAQPTEPPAASEVTPKVEAATT